MDIVLLDTSVASFLHPKKSSSPERLWYQPRMRDKILALSFQSVAELLFWAEENQWGEAQKAALDLFLQQFLVIPYDYKLAQTWAQVMKRARAVGRRLEAGDAWIVATAVDRSIPLLTHDRDLLGLPLPELQVYSFLAIP